MLGWGYGSRRGVHFMVETLSIHMLCHFYAQDAVTNHLILYVYTHSPERCSALVYREHSSFCSVRSAYLGLHFCTTPKLLSSFAPRIWTFIFVFSAAVPSSNKNTSLDNIYLSDHKCGLFQQTSVLSMAQHSWGTP